jgi:hypothetical protein
MTMDESPAMYSVKAAKDHSKISFGGTLRLQGRQEYEKILKMLQEAAEKSGGPLEIDMSELKFLNSSGISTFSLFLIEMRRIGKKISITGSKSIAWQSKSLVNFRRLYDQVTINLV